MNYSLTMPDGKVVPLSGLLALPRDLVSRRLVSFQHGTTTTRTAVPSKPESLNAARVMSRHGADVRATNVGPVGHEASMLESAPLILAWLREPDAAATGRRVL